MKRLVLAISSVFCLQLGFIGYNSADPSVENSFVIVNSAADYKYLAASVVEPFTADKIISDIPVDQDTEQPQTLAASRPDSFEPKVGRALHTVRARTTQRKQHDLNSFVSLENAAALKPVSVTYRIRDGVEFKQYEPKVQRTEYPAAYSLNEAKNYQASAKLATRPKKKNLFARVIRKPYDWLKAIGSTFK